VLIDALIAVVNEPGGTGFRARLPDVTVAGKTGTAQVMRLGAVRVRAAQLNYLERDHAWFAAFAPAEDPEIVVIVLNEHSGFGGASAAPAAAAILSKYFELKKVDGQAFGKVSPPPTPVTAIVAASDDPLPVPPPYKAIEPAKPSVTELPDAGLAPVAVEPIPTAPDAVTVPPSELEGRAGEGSPGIAPRSP
jgi:penicillin-binding protein 2